MKEKNAETVALVVHAPTMSLQEITKLPEVSEEKQHPRDFWPSRISVTTLARVSTSNVDETTAICALAVGSRFPLPSSQEMRKGTALHKAVLPRAAGLLQEQGVQVRQEWEFSHEAGITGRVDLYIPDPHAPLVVEFKTASARRSPRPYDFVQASLYSVFVAPCLLVIASVRDERIFYAHSLYPSEWERWSAPAIKLLEKYQERREKDREKIRGRCPLCPYFSTCERRGQ